MLETFYNNFGFTGALITAFLLFLCFIFWIAGLAGICMKNEDNRKKAFRIIVAVLIPPYPFCWMIWDMISQKKALKSI